MAGSALDDVRILDLAGETGAYCTKLLADLGADVIRIEPPAGDPLRMIGPFWRDEAAPDKSLYFWHLNTSKRSITLDIASNDGRAVLERLVATADIVVETFAPGYLAGMRLGYDGFAAIRPDIILTSITGFGQDGPHARYAWSDIVGVAMSGMMTLAGDKEDPPNRPYGNQGYVCAGIVGAAGTMTALLHRDATGAGQHVDVSMQEALSINQETAMQTWDMSKTLRTRTGARGVIPIDLPGIGVFQAADGQVFCYLGTPGGAPWPVMLEWMNQEGLAEDLNEEPYKTLVENLNLRFLTGMVQQPGKLPEHLKNLQHLHGVFSRFCAGKGKWELYEEGQRRRLLFGIISTPEDLANNPQLQARGWYRKLPQNGAGDNVMYAGPPYRLSASPAELRRRPPLPGEHNHQVYVEELGYSAQDVERWRAAGIV
jgi:crotonobetainyl-CoA:carnitine CoA-transferase CaiB-like acyl-CoA transferase